MEIGLATIERHYICFRMTVVNSGTSYRNQESDLDDDWTVYNSLQPGNSPVLIKTTTVKNKNNKVTSRPTTTTPSSGSADAFVYDPFSPMSMGRTRSRFDHEQEQQQPHEQRRDPGDYYFKETRRKNERNGLYFPNKK